MLHATDPEAAGSAFFAHWPRSGRGESCRAETRSQGVREVLDWHLFRCAVPVLAPKHRGGDRQVAHFLLANALPLGSSVSDGKLSLLAWRKDQHGARTRGGTGSDREWHRGAWVGDGPKRARLWCCTAHANAGHHQWNARHCLVMRLRQKSDVACICRAYLLRDSLCLTRV